MKSLSSQARENALSSDDYAGRLEQRLVSLAASHDMLTAADFDGVALHDLIAMELSPYLTQEQCEQAMQGPPLALLADTVPMTTLLIHELASNAAKYGALSQPGGSVSVDWSIKGDDLEIRWTETGGPKVKPPSRVGFGMKLLRDAIPFEFGGKADLDFAENGLRATYTIPMSSFGQATFGQGGSEELSIENKADQNPHSPNKPLAALIVEDSYLLAAEHSSLLEDAGFANVELASNVQSVLGSIEKNSFDFALLDINLRTEMSFEVANVLAQAGVKFAFVTGYSSEATIPTSFSEIPVLSKPLKHSSLSSLLKEFGLKKSSAVTALS